MQFSGAKLHQFVYAVYAPHRFIERHLIICGKAAYVPAGQLPLLRIVAKLFVIFGYGVRRVYAAKLVVCVIRLIIAFQFICAYCVAMQRVLIIRRFFLSCLLISPIPPFSLLLCLVSDKLHVFLYFSFVSVLRRLVEHAPLHAVGKILLFHIVIREIMGI